MAMLESVQRHQFFSINNWLHHHVQPGWVKEFNAKHVQWNIVPPLVLTIPIICVDMPLMQATVDEKGIIDSLKETTAFIADEQVHLWPGKVHRVLWTHPFKRNRGYAWALVVVAHVDSLMDILVELAEWAIM
jgi:hypothetical protein